MASKRPAADATEEAFEALYKRLEDTVSKLEQGNLSLEESLSLYEDGMSLAKRCQEILQGAEQRVTRLQEQFSNSIGTLRDEPTEYDAEVEFDNGEERPE